MRGADNSAALLAARRAVSNSKRQAVLDTARWMLDHGVTITYSSVARKAGVSAGLVHSPGLKAVIADAIELQARTGRTTPASSRAFGRASLESLQNDLETALADLRDLRAENTALTDRVRRDLGAQVELMNYRGTSARIEELEERVRTLVRSESVLHQQARTLQARVDDLEEELAAARVANTKLMRQINSQDLP